jgi:tetraacyldisaccharide 4'-kinase
VDLPGTPLLVAGIANPKPLLEYLKKQYPKTALMEYRDHHAFSHRDVQKILKLAEQFDCVVTTEKDYMRMQQTSLVQQLGEKLIVVPIKTDFGEDKETFDRAVMLYVAENNRQKNTP